jgi:catechol 2,3-dioxygenase-like lactoylglutathione lyase family enzyme
MLELDHIVIATPDMKESISQYGNQFAVKAIKGGEHEDWGTYNYLSFFSNDGYLEFLGINDIEKAKQSANPLIRHLVYVTEESRFGAFQFGLRTKYLDSYIAHFEESNIPYQGPFPGERRKTDGTVLKWRMLFPDYNHEHEVLPFLIEWEDPDAVFSEPNLSNAQSITKIKYGGLPKEVFAHIYQLKLRKLNKNQLHLFNSKILFDDDRTLRFDLA